MGDEKQGEPQTSQRIEVVLRVEYKHPADILSDYITSLGEGGMFIHTNLPLEPGQTITFALSFPGLLDPFELKGVVRFRRSGEDKIDEPEGLGIEFLFASDEQRERLRDLLAALEQPASPRAEPSPYRVLLVEDNEFAMELFDYALRRFKKGLGGGEDLEILHAGDAYKAQEHLAQTPLDLAIVDHYLPGMTGAELIRKMRSDPRTATVPVLMVSVGGDAVRQQAYESGADLFLDKPVLHKQLINTIAKLLARKNKR